LKHLSENLSPAESLDELLHRFKVDDPALNAVASRYPFRISAYYASLIKKPFDPIWLQAIPSLQELDDDQQPDPLDEERLSPVPGLIHRYPDRAVLLASNSCAVYCRFCMRKRSIGCVGSGLDLAKAIAYIAETPALKDILVSGGDPLMLPPDYLDNLLEQLTKIPHVEIIRIGSRLPVTDPERITPQLCRMLAKHHPLYLNTHFNHPAELTEQSARACELLIAAGIPLANQTVLLKGVNDSTTVLDKLFRGLLRMRVRPYYLHQMDLVKGTAHFRTALAKGMELMDELRGKISGMAIPHFVVDLPEGKGKVPLLKETARCVKDGLWQVRSYNGDIVDYTDPN